MFSVLTNLVHVEFQFWKTKFRILFLIIPQIELKFLNNYFKNTGVMSYGKKINKRDGYGCINIQNTLLSILATNYISQLYNV